MTVWGFHGRTWLWLGGRRCREKERARGDFERPEHAPISPGGAQTCDGVYTRASCVPRSRERVKTIRGRKRRGCRCAKKVHFVHVHRSLARRLFDGTTRNLFFVVCLSCLFAASSKFPSETFFFFFRCLLPPFFLRFHD